MEDIIRTDYDLQQGDRYRQLPKGDSSPTDPKWDAYDKQLKAKKREEKAKAKTATDDASESPMPATIVPAVSPKTETSEELTKEDEAFIKVLNEEHYGPCLPPHTKHDTFQTETSHWLLRYTDNDPQKAITMAYRLDYVRNWTPQPGEIEDLINSAAKKKLLTRYPKALKEIMKKAGINLEKPAVANKNADPMSDLPFDQWCNKIEELFDVFPCLREVCEPHPRRLWPFLLFASAAMFGSCMTLTYYFFYDHPGVRHRLNFCILGVGEPTAGKGTLGPLADAALAPIIDSDEIADKDTNDWKEKFSSTGANKEKETRHKIYTRMFGPRTSNTEFIRSMMNCKEFVDGEDMYKHLVTVDSEKDNSINMSKSGGWQNRDIMTLKSFHNEWDDQHYSNKESVSGRFRVYWNQIETCTPPTLRRLVNERNVNSGLDTRMAVIPMGKPDFSILPLEEKRDNAVYETIKQWAYKLDQRKGELPLWPLVEHVHNWLDKQRAIAEFNEDLAQWLLLKRVPHYGLSVAAPYVDMRHTPEREKTGTYHTDDKDAELCTLICDIQYRCQMFWFYELHRKYYDDELCDAAMQRRRTTKFQECFRLLSDEFTTERFSQVFGYANNRSGQKTLERLLEDKAIERTMRGHYKKLVSELPTI